MDFIPSPVLDGSIVPSWLPPVTGASFALGFSALAFLLFSPTRRKIARAVFSGLAFVGVFTALGMVFVDSNYRIQYMEKAKAAKAEWKTDVAKEFEETYGIRLAPEELQALRYPKEKPEEDSVAYGSIPYTHKVGDDIKQTNVTLIWSDGKMLLGTNEESTIVPLEPVAS